jgi:hypothetical protein
LKPRFAASSDNRSIQPVGWVERSETHQSLGSGTMGFASLNPSYELSAICRLDAVKSGKTTACAVAECRATIHRMCDASEDNHVSQTP